MILTIRELELLKLLCWCRTIPAPENWCSPIYDKNMVSALEISGFIWTSRNGRYIRTRPAAYRILETAGFHFCGDSKPQTKQQTLNRRNTAARILFTFYLAGADVFKDTIGEASDRAVYVPSFAARSASTGNPFGSTKFYGIYHTAGTLYLVFYADDAGVYFQKELTLFHSYIDRSHIQNTGLIFMGGSVPEIGDTVFLEPRSAEQPKKKYNTDSFGRVFSITSLPVHFVPVGQCGVRMLRYMAMEHYRERLAKMILRKSYRPPYDTLPDTDAIHYQPPYLPAVVALDMDVKRIDRAVSAAKGQGYPQIVLYSLPEQVPFLRERYRGAADVIAVDAERLDREINGTKSGQDNAQPYITKEGRCIDVADFAAYRKSKT